VIGVADIAAHRQAEQLSAEMISRGLIAMR
jgi:hypothetical protein